MGNVQDLFLSAPLTTRTHFTFFAIFATQVLFQDIHVLLSHGQKRKKVCLKCFVLKRRILSLSQSLRVGFYLAQKVWNDFKRLDLETSGRKGIIYKNFKAEKRDKKVLKKY